jgi:hypothetical protein
MKSALPRLTDEPSVESIAEVIDSTGANPNSLRAGDHCTGPGWACSVLPFSVALRIDLPPQISI